jgi:hypothetical protein
MRLPKLDVLIGHVVKVQLSTETHVAGQASETAPLSVRSSVVNRMRVFVRTAEGKERDVVLANSTIGVREGHHLAIALAKPPGQHMLAVTLINLTTGQREEFRDAFAAAVRQKIVDARRRGGARFRRRLLSVRASVSAARRACRYSACGRGAGVCRVVGDLRRRRCDCSAAAGKSVDRAAAR